jgi:hypothetical protein
MKDNSELPKNTIILIESISDVNRRMSFKKPEPTIVNVKKKMPVAKVNPVKETTCLWI